MIGKTVGPFQVVDKLGEGGMGEVYRARDTSLNRDVALKVLPDAVADDAERLARFQREAEVLASLNHPNIAAIYGLEKSGDTRALVLELVEGPTLADKIAHGPIPVDEALLIAKQIAEALEAAHEQGIIHRDLKPANIKLRADGTVKVLDFGLAKALEKEQVQADQANSPTLTAAGSQVGVIMGTAAYMSPEQARGGVADYRSDIWAFGAVLMEMLTGRQTFTGNTVSDTLAFVLTREPDWATLPTNTPAPLRRLLRRCLEKEQKQRLGYIGDARLDIDDARHPMAEESDEVRRVVQLAVWQRPSAVGSTVLMALLIGGLAVWGVTRPASPQVMRFTVNTPPDGPLRLTNTHRDVALSPDGTRVVYQSGVGRANSQLYVRHVDQLEGSPLRGTEGGQTPFFSPDGDWVGFTDLERNIKRVSIFGGPAVTIAPSLQARGLSWGPDDTIVFATNASQGLLRVPAVGGEPEQLTKVELDQGETHHWWPDVLPNGKGVLFTAWAGSDEASRLAVVSLETGEIRYLLPGGSHPQYSATGHIVYGVDGTLRAVGFDADSLTLTSDNPIPVLEDINTKTPSGAANFRVSGSGSLVYVRGESAGESRRLVWVDRDGREEAVELAADEYSGARLSPDGTRIAVQIQDSRGIDIWVSELDRGTLTRVTTDPALDYEPLWTPDGERIVFSSSRETGGLFSRAFDGTGPVERLMTLGREGTLRAGGWSSDGERLVFSFESPNVVGAFDIGILSTGGEPAWEPLLETEAHEREPVISPDGNWLAYTSVETGQPEVYVQRFPELGERRQVSTQGGSRPRWSPNGRELFYVRGNLLMVVPVETQPSFRAGTPEAVFEGPDLLDSAEWGFSDISPDAQRFLIVLPNRSATATAQIVFVQNWHQELEAQVPPP